MSKKKKLKKPKSKKTAQKPSKNTKPKKKRLAERKPKSRAVPEKGKKSSEKQVSAKKSTIKHPKENPKTNPKQKKQKKAQKQPKGLKKPRKPSRYNITKKILKEYLDSREIKLKRDEFNKIAKKLYEHTKNTPLKFVGQNVDNIYESFLESRTERPKPFEVQFPFYNFSDIMISHKYRGVRIVIYFENPSEQEKRFEYEGEANEVNYWFRNEGLYAHCRLYYNESPVAFFKLVSTDDKTYAEYVIVTGAEMTGGDNMLGLKNKLVTLYETLKKNAPKKEEEPTPTPPPTTPTEPTETDKQIELAKINLETKKVDLESEKTKLEATKEQNKLIENLKALGMTNEQMIQILLKK